MYLASLILWPGLHRVSRSYEHEDCSFRKLVLGEESGVGFGYERAAIPYDSEENT